VRRAAQIVSEAAEALADEASEANDVSRYLLAADRLTAVLDSPRSGRRRLLMASPVVTESSGRTRTLVEMIEMIDDEHADDAYRLRLAKILLRALPWHPEIFPAPPG
jgi:hypothetical protein